MHPLEQMSEQMSIFAYPKGGIKPSQRVQEIEHILLKGCGTRPTTANRVALLNDAGEMYAALIKALHHAHRTIHLEYYIFDDDRIGQTISEVLIRRARSGVKVRVIYDILGSWMPAWGMLGRLRKAGVEVSYFRPFDWGHPWRSLNIRNHRKIAIIDDRIAFIGGINIARRYLEGNELGRWRDEHLRIEGEAVRDLQELFYRDRIAVGCRPIEAVIRSQGVPDAACRTLIGWSEEGPSRGALEQSLVALIRSAEREILLSTPYYIPTPPLRAAISEALRRGVRVALMTPARGDLWATNRASEAYYGELLREGGVILHYEKGFLHTKLVVVDHRICYIGTANLDYRSLRTNWEVAAFIDHAPFARQLTETFSKDRASCSELTFRGWSRRPLHRRIAGYLARLLSKWL